MTPVIPQPPASRHPSRTHEISLSYNVRDKSLPFKGAYNPSDNQGWIRKLQDHIANKGRIVALDTRNANQAAINDLAAIVKKRLE
ncbi:hypothetical protein [Streptomyces griseolus]|uniref:hypothetical protein n=1 Tax=Streptomyces griseolus TaxID=1909 RepID=UPI002244A7A1|nr:hypothetical protein [Streptomyces griseolus]MCW8216236.1 hypothetical protein [Streptomyces griseolus]